MQLHFQLPQMQPRRRLLCHWPTKFLNRTFETATTTMKLQLWVLPYLWPHFQLPHMKPRRLRSLCHLLPISLISHLCTAKIKIVSRHQGHYIIILYCLIFIQLLMILVLIECFVYFIWSYWSFSELFRTFVMLVLFHGSYLTAEDDNKV